MRGFRHLAAVIAIAGLVTGSAATAASAAASQPAGAQGAAAVHLRGGATAVGSAECSVAVAFWAFAAVRAATEQASTSPSGRWKPAAFASGS